MQPSSLVLQALHRKKAGEGTVSHKGPCNADLDPICYTLIAIALCEPSGSSSVHRGKAKDHVLRRCFALASMQIFKAITKQCLIINYPPFFKLTHFSCSTSILSKFYQLMQDKERANFLTGKRGKTTRPNIPCLRQPSLANRPTCKDSISWAATCMRTCSRWPCTHKHTCLHPKRKRKTLRFGNAILQPLVSSEGQESQLQIANGICYAALAPNHKSQGILADESPLTEFGIASSKMQCARTCAHTHIHTHTHTHPHTA